ncbi:MAG: 50S ribosomal protein L4 [Burkholderiales bacterium]
MELKLIDTNNGQAAGSVNASDTLFGRDYNEALIHQIVTGFMANGRQGTRAQKGRSEINKSTKKPWKQKGTGRARAGMASSPLWRGGGRIFPNLPDENFSQKINRKMYRAGMCSILSQLARDGRLSVVDGLTVEAPKTKLLAQKIKGMGFDRVLIITDEIDDNLFLSARNLANVLVLEPRHADPVSLLRFDHTIMTKAAVAKFEEMLG